MSEYDGDWRDDQIEKINDDLDELRRQLTGCGEREKELREALAWYADKDNWIDRRKWDDVIQAYTGETTNAKEDNGARARRALDGEKE